MSALQHRRIQELKRGPNVKTQTNTQIRQMQLQIKTLQSQVADLQAWADAHQLDDNEVRDDLAHLQKEVEKLKF